MHIKLALKAQNNKKLNALCYWLLMNEVQREKSGIKRVNINHIKRVAGIDHVGLGAGFDGIN